MASVWRKAQNVLLLVVLWQLTLCGLCTAGNFSESGSGTGSSGMTRPFAVMNLTVSYNSSDSTFIVTWEDSLNTNDTNRGYRISYFFSALGTQLDEQTIVSILNVSMSDASFQYDILAGPHAEPGVTVTVMVQACNNFGLGSSAQMMLTLDGDFSPSPVNFTIMASNVLPSITLSWDNPFSNVPPDQVTITYTATKLTGVPLPPTGNSASRTVDRVNLTMGMDFDSSYTLSSLLYYTEYNVSLVATYNGNQTSVPVRGTATTIEGAPGPVRNVSLVFNGTPLTFDPDTRELNVSLSISWLEPTEPNGLISSYTYTLLDVSNATILGPSSTNMTQVSVDASVTPYEEYRVRVTALTGNGEGVEASSDLERSPEAAPSPTSMINTSNVTSTSALVSWSEPADPNGVITRYSLILTGDAAPVSYNVSGMETSFNLSELRPFTEYSVSVRGVTGGGRGQSGPSANFTTLEDVPTVVQALDLVVNGSHLTVTWGPPMMPNGVVSYSVTLSGLNLVDNMAISISDSSMIVMDTMYTVAHSSLPYSNYTAVVFAFTSAGSSPEQTVTEQTPEEAPSAVRELNLTAIEDQLVVSWVAPSMPNGPGIITYSVTVSGVNLVNNELINISNSSVNITDTMYTVAHSSLPYSNYTAVVFASTSAGPSPEETVTEQTPEAAPSAVRQLNLNITDSDLIVTWDPPMMPNGVVSYNVTLSGVNLVDNMAINISDSSMIVTDTMYTVAHSSLPYSNYTAVVFASTSAGPSPEETVTEQTPEAAPSAVRQLNLNVTDSHLTVSWDTPMMPNGVVSYSVMLSGVNLVDNMAISISNSSVNLTDTMYTVAHSSLPYSNYTAVVFASTSAGSSPEETVTEQTPEEEPSVVRQLTLAVNDSHLIVMWDVPMMPNGVVSYNITLSGVNLVDDMPIEISDSSMIVMDTMYTVAHSSLPYSNYTAVVFAFTSAGPSPEETVTEQTPEEAPSAVRELNLTVATSYLTVSWDIPVMPNGVVSYSVTLSGVNLVDNMAININDSSVNLTDTMYTVAHSSLPYSNYTAVVFAFTSAGSSPEETVTEQTPEAAPSAVRQLNLNVTDSQLIVTWDPPMMPNGVVSYNVTLSGLNLVDNMAISISDSSMIVMDTMYTVAHSSLPYSNYTAVVFASTSAGSSPEQTVTEQTPEEAPSAVRELNLTAIEDQLIVSWVAPSMPNGPGIITYSVTVSGVNLVNNELIDISNSSVNITDTMYTVAPSLPYSNYTAVVFAFTSAGSSPEQTATEQTPEAAPSDVRQLNLNVTDSDLIVTWDVPTMPNGVVSYNVTLSGLNLVDNMAISISDSSMIVMDTMYTVAHSSLPYSNYTAVVFASTSTGSSPEETVTEQTPEEAPSAVRELNLTAIEDQLVVSWVAPSMPNGPGIITYSVTVSGVNLVNNELIDISNSSVNITDTMYTVTPSLPYSNYTAVVFAFTSAGSSPEQTATEQTPEAAPSAVSQLNLNVTGSHLTVTWDPPMMPNGVVSYSVTLSGVNLVDNLAININDSSVHLTDTMYTVAHSSLPYSNYTAVVFASTSAGPSPEETVTEQTPEAAPGTVRNLTAAYIIDVPSSYNQDSGLYNGTLDISWLEPEFPNGVISEYTYTVEGPSPSGTLITDSTASTSAMFEVQLLPVEMYMVIVTAVTMGGPGVSSSVTITVPEATPSPVTNLTITISSSSSLSISWDPPLTPNGALTYNISLSFTDLATNVTEMVLQRQNPEESRTVVYDSTQLLEPYARYDATVIAITSVDSSTPASANVTTAQGKSEAPRNLMADPTNTTVAVSWMAPLDPNGVISTYTIIVNDSDLSEVERLNSSDISAEFSALRPFSNYSVSVRALTGENGGLEGESAAITFMTEPGIPTVPQNLMITGVTQTGFNATWDRPSMLNAPTVFYNLRYRTVTDTDVLVENIADTTYPIADLVSSVTYLVSVQACSLVGCSGFTGEKSVTTGEGVPSPVTNLTITISSSSSSLNISWDPPLTPNGALTYNISLSFTDLATDEVQNVLQVQTSEDNRTVLYSPGSLEPYARYKVSVMASTSAGNSDPVTAEVDTAQGESEAPRNLTADPTNTTVAVSWIAPLDPNGVIFTYTIIVSDSDLSEVERLNSSDVSAEFSALRPFSNYSVSVRALTGESGELEGESAMITFMTEPGTPSAPTLTLVNSTSSTTLQVTWLEPASPNGIITSYVVSYYETGLEFSPVQTRTAPGTATTLQLEGLDVFTNYSVFVQAITVLLGPPSNTLTAVTEEASPGRPENVTAVELTSTAVNVSWSPPTLTNGILRSYVVYYRIDTNLREEFVIVNAIEGASQQFIVLTNLTEFTSYFVQVSALTGAGEGERSEIVAVTTDPDSATPPTAVSVMVINSTALMVQFGYPMTPNGKIRGYIIEYGVPDSETLMLMGAGTMFNYSLDTVNDNRSQTVEVGGLDPFTYYVFRVAAFSFSEDPFQIHRGVFSPDTNPVRTDEDVPSAPLSFTLNQVPNISSQLSATWQPPNPANGIILSYSIYCAMTTMDGTPPPGSHTLRATTPGNDSTKVVIMGLEAYTYYQCHVTANTSVGEGPESNRERERTAEDVPDGPPQNLVLTVPSSTSINVTWEAPPSENQRGMLTNYTVTYFISEEEVDTVTSVMVAPTVLYLELTRLDEFTNYTVSVRASTAVGPGPAVIMSVRTLSDVPSEPLNLAYTNDTSTSVNLTWDPPADPNGVIENYTLSITNVSTMSDQSDPRVITDISGDLTEYLVTGLLPFRTYEFMLTAFTDRGSGPVSMTLTVYTLEDLPTAPLNFQLSSPPNSTPSELEAMWSAPDPPNGIITNYTVYCNTSLAQAYPQIMGGVVLSPVVLDGDTLSTVIMGLGAYTSYDCHVTATTSAGEGTASVTMTQRTAQDAPSDPPQNFESVSVEATQVTLSWSRPTTPNGEITGYTLTYTNDTGTETQSIPLSETVTDFVVSDLNEFTRYNFSLTAMTVGTGPAATLAVNTSEAAPSASPQNLRISIGNETSLLITWQPPPVQDQNGVLGDYQVTYRATDVVGGSEVMDVPGESVTLVGLNIFTRYNVSVRAQTSVGLGPEITGIGRTNSTVPAAPVNVAAPDNEVTPTSILVTWEPPSPVYGDVTMYSIEYSSDVDNGSMNVPADDRSANLTGLMEFVTYTITVYAFTDNGRGDGGVVVQTTREHNPDEPTNFTAMALTSTSIELTWGPPEDPNGVIISYHLEATVDRQDTYITMTGLEGLNEIVGNESSRSYVLTGLHPFVLYIFSLSASTGAGEGTPTPNRTAETREAIPAQPVRDINVTTESPTSIRISWLPPLIDSWNGPITQYTIAFSPVSNCDQKDPLSFTTPGMRTLTTFTNPSNPREVGSDGLSREELLISDLEEFVGYVFTVSIATSAGETMSTDSCKMTFPAAPAVAPVITSYSITSNTTATLQWEELPLVHRNGLISHYVIMVTNDRNTVVVLKNSTDTTSDLTDLVPFTSYTVSVSAVNQVGRGPYSPDMTDMTLQGVPDAPRIVTLTALSPKSIRVEWTAPAEFYGVPGPYLITYTGTKDPLVLYVNVSSDQTSHVLEELIGDNTYTVSVQASTGAGVGEADTVTVSTPRGASPPVEVTPNTATIVPVQPVDSSGMKRQPSSTSFSVAFDIIPEQQVNGPVDKVWIFVQRMPSENKAVGTYYESNRLTGNWPKYPCLEVNASSSVQGRKKRATEITSVQQTIGGTDTCGPDDMVCNGPLEANTMYGVGYRLFSGTESVDYEFENATFSTVEASSDLITIAVPVVIVLLVAVVIVVIILIVVTMHKKRSGKFTVPSNHKNGSQKLIPRDNGSVPFLSPSDPNIVPINEMVQAGGGGTPVKFATLPRANSRKIYLKDFGSFLRDMLDDSGYKFSEEYERVTEVGLDHAKEASLMAENRAKNRYTNILAYDHSRVKLSFVDDEPGSDYINACFIPGYRMRRAYIATQGPLPATFDDFWRMVWEQNSHVIVMLTQLVERGRTKCHRYWPGTDPSVYGDIAVELVSEHEKEDWTVREFKLSTIPDRKSRLIKHYQFTSWPDHGVPDTPVAAVDFVRTVRTHVAGNHGPITVHCSAGVGRTGCFIALDSLLQQLNDHDWVDVLALACEMRQHRNHMIQTEAQYVFIHKAIHEVIEAEMSVNGGGFSQSGGFSQTGGFPSLYINQFAEDNTQMTDYYGEDFLSMTEETHM